MHSGWNQVFNHVADLKKQWLEEKRFASPFISLSLKNPMQITPAVARKLQEKFLLMAAVGDVPDVTGQKMAVGARHRMSLRACVSTEKNER